MKKTIYKRLAVVLVVVSVLSGCVGAGVQQDRDKGDFYYDEKNYREAIKWYRKAAEQGDEQAQNYLGVMYYNGDGVIQDYQEAAKWYKLAAKQGEKWAQSNLGAMYHNGEGVKQNYREAAKWYRLAAKQGLHLALFNLGTLYYYGNGVEQDYKESYVWYSLALYFGDGNRAIDKRDILTEKLSRSELKEAQIEAERRRGGD